MAAAEHPRVQVGRAACVTCYPDSDQGALCHGLPQRLLLQQAMAITSVDPWQNFYTN